MNKSPIVILSLLASTGIMGMEPKVKKTHILLPAVKAMCSLIHHKAQKDNFNPELLVGIARGGLTPLSLLAGEAMFNNRNCMTVAVASYDENDQQKDLSLLFPVHFEAYKNFKSVLLIDDLVDSGKTVDFILRLFKKEMPEAAVKVATLFYKKKSVIKPDYYVHETTDWIVFPWEE